MPIIVNYTSPQQANVQFCFTVLVAEDVTVPVPVAAAPGVKTPPKVTYHRAGQAQGQAQTGSATPVQTSTQSRHCYTLPAGTYQFTVTSNGDSTTFQIVVA